MSNMAQKEGFKALNKTLKDIRDNEGITVLFAGNVRHSLPVVSRGTLADEIKVYIKASHL